MPEPENKADPEYEANAGTRPKGKAEPKTETEVED